MPQFASGPRCCSREAPITRDLERNDDPRPLRVAGLFAGVGGIELGLHRSGHVTAVMCEIDPFATHVLETRFPGVPIARDIRDLTELPDVDLVAAGFPCQDLSQAGRTAGIDGARSGLVDHVFRLIDSPTNSVKWLLLENVPFMLRLAGGRAMDHLTRRLGEMGFVWAYRVVDTRAFGLPQRRKRVLLLASRSEDPRAVLFSDEASPQPDPDWRGRANGFYWTEGSRGLGWAPDAVPTLKGGSSVGIASPPAIWMPDDRIVTPDIRDAERLQGFPADWTLLSNAPARARGIRWRLVGNAVSVPVAEWIGSRLSNPPPLVSRSQRPHIEGTAWPMAAWGSVDGAFTVDISDRPLSTPQQHLAEFLRFEPQLLSHRATAGFHARIQSSTLRFPEGFKDAVARHLASMRTESAAA